MMNRLLQIFEEANGRLSSTRIAFVLWSLIILGVWTVLSLRNGQMQAFDMSIVSMLGIMLTGKVVQKFGEKTEAAVTETK